MKGDSCAFMQLSDFKDETFRSGLQKLLSADVHKENLYVVQQRDGHLHISACSKSVLQASIAQASAVPPTTKKVQHPVIDEVD